MEEPLNHNLSSFSDEELRRKARFLERKIDENLDLISPNEDLDRNIISNTENILSELSNVYYILSTRNSHLTSSYNEKLNGLKRTFKIKKRQYFENEERKQLFNTSINNEGQGSSELSVNMNILLGDKESLHRSNRSANILLEQGNEVRNILSRGRMALEDMTGRLEGSLARFTSIDKVMNSIRRAKVKQTVIISIVIALCTCFLLWYWLRS